MTDAATKGPGLGWPDTSRRVVVLADTAGSLERRLVEDWLARAAPAAGAVSVVTLQSSRRGLVFRGDALSLRRVLKAEDDPLLLPVRVVWLAPTRDGRRAVRLSDLFKYGDPRDPTRLGQEWIKRFHPDRVRVLVGEPAAVSELAERWEARRASAFQDGSGFLEFVAVQAALALERAERQLRGSRYKVPRFVNRDILSRGAFRIGVARIASEQGRPPDRALSKARRYLKEIAATHSTFVIDLMAALIRLLYTQGYSSSLRYSRKDLEKLYELGQQYPLAFLPSHKSNLDHLVLMYALHENGLPPNHTAGGINMNFFPVGPLLRRAGVFFIRRSFRENVLYKFVLKQYLDYLLAKRFPLEWFIEGGRSRTGKLRAPQYGMLSYVVDSYRTGSTDDLVLIPVSIAYDQIQDVGSYAAEQRGEAKESESFSWMVRAIRTLRRRYGRIFLRFGEPISVAARVDPGSTDPNEIEKLAFEVMVRINRVTPVTPISLVTLALLGAGERAVSVDETLTMLEDFLVYVKRRELPITEELSLDTPERVERALDALVDHGVVSKFATGPETVYSIEARQQLPAAYYRNTIIHFFVNGAIAETALAAAAATDEDRTAVFWATIAELRDLLKFEFFFAERAEFRDEIADEVSYHAAGWETALNGGTEDVLAVLRSVRPFSAHWVLRPFVDAYRIVADALVLRDPDTQFDEKAFVKECLALGEQYRRQQTIKSGESVSTVLFGAAIRLVQNRELIEPGTPGLAERRAAFAEQLAHMADRVDQIESLAAARIRGG